jgi:hypothetical protein
VGAGGARPRGAAGDRFHGGDPRPAGKAVGPPRRSALAALEPLTQITGQVSLVGNHVLASLAGLRNATHVGSVGGAIELSDHAQLPQAVIDAFLAPVPSR